MSKLASTKMYNMIFFVIERSGNKVFIDSEGFCDDRRNIVRQENVIEVL